GQAVGGLGPKEAGHAEAQLVALGGGGPGDGLLLFFLLLVFVLVRVFLVGLLVGLPGVLVGVLGVGPFRLIAGGLALGVGRRRFLFGLDRGLGAARLARFLGGFVGRLLGGLGVFLVRRGRSAVAGLGVLFVGGLFGG